MTSSSPVLVIPSSADISSVPLCAAQIDTRESARVQIHLPSSNPSVGVKLGSAVPLALSSGSLDPSAAKSQLTLASPSASSQSSATSRSPNSTFSFVTDRQDNLNTLAMQAVEESSDSPRSDLHASYDTDRGQHLNQRPVVRPISYNPSAAGDANFGPSHIAQQSVDSESARPASLVALLREAQARQDFLSRSQPRPAVPGLQGLVNRDYANLKTLAAAAADPSGRFQPSNAHSFQPNDEESLSAQLPSSYRALGVAPQNIPSYGSAAANPSLASQNASSQDRDSTAADFAAASGYLLSYPHLSSYVTQSYAAAPFPFQADPHRSGSPVASGGLAHQGSNHFLGYPPRMPVPLYGSRNPYQSSAFPNHPQTSAAFSAAPNQVDRMTSGPVAGPSLSAYSQTAASASQPVLPLLPMFQTPNINRSYLPPFTQNAPSQSLSADPSYQLSSRLLSQPPGASSVTLPNRFPSDMPPLSPFPQAAQRPAPSPASSSAPSPAASSSKPKRASSTAERFSKKKPSSSSSSSSKSSRARRGRSHSSDSTSTSSSVSTTRNRPEDFDDEKGAIGGSKLNLDDDDEEELDDDEEGTDDPEDGDVPSRVASGSSKSSSSSDKNRKSKAGGTRKYGCEICHKQFYQSSNLVTHYRTHTGERPFACTFEGCGRSFTQSSNLKRHLRVHSGEKPFECSECGKKCSRRASLVAHFRVHTGEKPFECPFCQKRFSIKNSLMVHQRTHSGKPHVLPESPSV